MMYSLGIIGGLGPKASSFFLERLYHKSTRRTDEDYPDVAMLSFSSFPDRTNAILTGKFLDIYNKLADCIRYLNQVDVSEIIILCFTLHAIIRSLGNIQEKKLVMLDTVLLNLIKKRKEKTLVLCSKGTITSGLFSPTADSEINSLLITPDMTDVNLIHEMIYTIKSRGANEEMLHFISYMVKKYSVNSIAYGCTELHMLQGLNSRNIHWNVIDPLEQIIDLFANNNLRNFHSGEISIKAIFEQPEN